MENVKFIKADEGRLSELIPCRRITVKEETVSTNTDSAALIRGGEPCGFLVAANRQTGGRGRRGRTFVSEGGGVYFSFDVKLYDRNKISLITPTAGVAVADALRGLYGLDAKIKWVNDIFVRGGKISGILAEGAETPDGEMRVVVGVGINAVNTDFPDTATSIASSLEAAGAVTIDTNELIARVVGRFDETVFTKGAIDEYRALSFILGHRLRVHPFDGEEYDAVAYDISPDGSLIVKRRGETITLSSGEVSVTDEE